MRPDLEQEFIKKYVLGAKRERYLGFIANSKRRGAFLGMLYHGQDLNKSKLRAVSGNYQQQVEAVRLKTKSVANGDRCYIISVSPEWDGKELSSDEAISNIVCHVEATVLLFGNGAAVYYEGEAPYNYYLSV